MIEDENHKKHRKIKSSNKIPFVEEEVKLEERLKELEKKQNDPNYNPREGQKYKNINNKVDIKSIEDSWKPLKNRLIDLGVFDKDKSINLFSGALEKSITNSLEHQTSSSKDIEIELLRQQVETLRNELKVAHTRAGALERQLNDEDELNKILNSSFGGSDPKSFSFYGVPTKGAKSPNLPRNMTHMRGPAKPLDLSDHSDKIQESLKYYKYKTRTLEKSYGNLKEKFNKLNNRSKRLYALNENLITALKAQKNFDKLSGDRKTVTCKN